MNQKASVSVRVLCAATGFLSLYGIVFLERGVSQQDPAERVERRQQSGWNEECLSRILPKEWNGANSRERARVVRMLPDSQ